jgi:peptidyl-prolyl cis-trans isomerase C
MLRQAQRERFSPESGSSVRAELVEAPSPARHRLRGRLLREPLLHFLLVGALLFATYRYLNPAGERLDVSHRIEITPDDLRQMSVAWLAQGRPPPTAEQMRSLVETWIHDEVLFREALALGLDKNDTIVKRRMVQKMDFLAEDLSALREPTRAELEAWFQQHAERFADPPRVTFRHLYFSPDRRGAETHAAAEQARATLSGKPVDAPETRTVADPFMFQSYYPDRDPEQIAKDFGPGFARALFTLTPGAWQGPIESGFGWHVVWVDALTPSRLPSFEEIEPAVKTAWVDEQREADKRGLYDKMKSQYVVVVPEDLTPPPIGANVPSENVAPE